MKTRLWIAALAIVGLMASSVAEARPPATTAAALRTLTTGVGEDLAEAMTFLKERKDLLTRNGRDLAKVVAEKGTDPDVLRRVIEVLVDRPSDGCAFIAGMVRKDLLPWVDLVIARFPTLPRCEALDVALAGILSWSADPVGDPGSARRVDRVLDRVREGGLVRGADEACRFVLAGPPALRRKALDTIRSIPAASTDGCLIQAYGEEARKGPSDFRAELLKAIASLAGMDSVPTLVLALERPEDRDLACDLLGEAGERGISSMMFAVRTSDVPPAGLRACLRRAGNRAVDAMLPMLDHPNAAVRGVAADHLREFHSDEAFEVLRHRFVDGVGRTPRSTCLEAIAAYPVEKMRDILEQALVDDDPQIRLLAADLVEVRHAREVVPTLTRAAEEDPDAGIRRRLLEALWRMGDPSAVPLVNRMAQYEEPEVVVAAVHLLGFLGDGDSLKILAGLRSSREAQVVDAARKALWVLSYQNPDQKKPSMRSAPKVPAPAKGRDLECGDARAVVIGRKGPVLMVLPGGPAMDLSWARPWLDVLGKDAVTAFVDPPEDGPGSAAGLVARSDLECLAGELGADRFFLLSSGLGGTHALALAAGMPDKVAGVLVISSPLPGRLDALAAPLRAALSEPFGSILDQIMEHSHRFPSDVLDRYRARLEAPAMGSDARDPGQVLNVSWNTARTAEARKILDRPDVRFEPAEFGGVARFLLPTDLLPDEIMEPYRAFQEAFPERVQVTALDGCGFMPQIDCARKVRGAVKDWLAKGGGKR
jgi:pimeloyl-ACP methyl ester carboxylesterase